MRWALLTGATQTLIIWFTSVILPGFTISGIRSAVITAVLLSVALAIAWPFIYLVAAQLHPILFPLLTFGLTGLVVVFAGQANIPGLEIEDIWTGIWISVCLTIGNVFLSTLFSLNDDRGYDWFVIRPLRRRYDTTPSEALPGLMFLEIDGLAEPVLRAAIEQGYMPTLRRWLETSTHRLLEWEPDLSSQTSASQAGILLGNNTDIPAFRWYDKQAGKIMLTSSLASASELELRLSNGHGLLTDGGASRWNIFSGDASDCLCTFSTVGAQNRTTSREYVAYFSNPYSVARTLALYVDDVVRERWQSWTQVRRNEQPRIDRTFSYALIRAAITTVMQEASRFMLVADMYRGAPAVYNTFFAYDEVAHHSGIDRTDAYGMLRSIDRTIACLEAAAERAPRPYHFVVLSDHGQSMGATFAQRYGQSLGDLVRGLISAEHTVGEVKGPDEDANAVNLAMTEAVRQEGRMSRPLNRLLGPHLQSSETDSSSIAGSELDPGTSTPDSNVVVLASGNLGLISFLDWKERMTYEQIVDAFPELLESLVRHEGISFVMVHSEQHGGIVIGPEGTFFLERDVATGVNPLLRFGPNAAHHLQRTDTFTNAPDILVNSLFDAETGEVAAFEELVGSHGGLGGTQTQPFVLYPSAFPAPAAPIVGAPALHQVLKNWRHTAQHTSTSLRSWSEPPK